MTVMDAFFQGTLWALLTLSALPQHKCSPMCPVQCYCDTNGVVRCVGYISDVPRHLSDSTFLLIMDRTKMNVIHERSLANRALLLRFSLTNSHLHTIHPRAFDHAPQLKSVKLSSNDLSAFPARVFTPLTLLDQLQLDGNRLETLAPDMLEGLGALKELDLSKNKLDNLPADLFDGLTQLVFLNLGRNSIKRLSPTIFDSLGKLQRLMIYNNELEGLEAGIFDRLHSLTELKLHSNNIRSLPPRIFWSLGNLKTLTLSSNQLQTIPEKSFYHMPMLEKLTLYKNPLLVLPDLLMGHVPGMTEFYLYETNLTTVPGNLFANMSGLLSLNLHINEHLSDLPHDLFCCLPRLNKLSLKSNNLLYLRPGLFSRLATVTLLFLNDNKLQSLPEDIFLNLGHVSTLDLRQNNFRTLPGHIFSSNTGLTSLTLGDNPWNCTCAIRGIAKWIKRNVHVIPDRQDIKCRSPEYQMLRTLDSLSDEDLGRCDARSTTHFPTEEPRRETTSYKPPSAISTRAQGIAAAPRVSLTSQPHPTTRAPATTRAATRRVTSTRADPTSRAPILRATSVPRPLPAWHRATPESLSDEDLGLRDARSTTHFPTEEPRRETTSYKPAFAISTRAQRTAAAPRVSLTSQPHPTTRAPATARAATRRVTSARADPTSRAPILRATSVPPPHPTATTGQTEPTWIPETRRSMASSDVFVFVDGPEYVHHHLLNGWVYVWSLPSDTVLFGLHMFIHVQLIIAGLVLILATIYTLRRLNNIMITLSSHISYQAIED